MVKYAIIGVEGPHDQAFVGKVLQLLGFKKFRGEESKLDDFWEKFKPTYPKKGNLYKRLDMPSILFTDSVSVAVYAGEGSSLPINLEDVLIAHSQYRTGIAAFGIVADADDKAANSVVQRYYDRFRNYFPNFPKSPGVVDKNTPRSGIYVLPDNASPGVLDTLICQCGEAVYPEYMKRAKSYLAEFSEEEREEEPLKWKPFDREKALVATVVSVLKPGSSNTASIANDDWVSNKSAFWREAPATSLSLNLPGRATQNEVAALASFIEFLRQLLEDS